MWWWLVFVVCVLAFFAAAVAIMYAVQWAVAVRGRKVVKKEA